MSGACAQDPLGVCLSRLALTQLFLGRPGTADRTMREAVRVATELENPMTIRYVRSFDAILAALEPDGHDLDAAAAAADYRHLDDAPRLLRDDRRAPLRVARRTRGDQRGLAAIRQAAARHAGRANGRSHTRAQPAGTRTPIAGQPAAGRKVVADALAWTERHGQRYLLPELLRIDAELLALSGGVERDAHGAAGRRHRHRHGVALAPRPGTRHGRRLRGAG